MKTNKTLTITILLALLLITSVIADDWTQYGSTPTINSIKKIRNIGANAMMIDSADLAYYYDGATWTPVSTPTTGLTGTSLSANFDMNTAGTFYWVFSNLTTAKVYTFNFGTHTFSTLVETITLTGLGVNLEVICSKTNANTCWTMRTSATTSESTLHGITATNASDIGSMSATSRLYTYNSPHIYRRTYSGGNYHVYRYNGVSWSDIFNCGSQDCDYAQYDTNYRIISYNNDIYTWNQTSNSFSIMADNQIDSSPSKIIMNPITLGVYGVRYSDNTKLGSLANYFDQNASTEATIGSNTLTTGYIDEASETGWLGLSNGNIFYYYKAPSSNATQSLHVSISPNPSVYGQSTIATAIPHHDLNLEAHIVVDFYNSSGSNVYGGECYTISGTCEIGISGSTYTNFIQGQSYNVTFVSTWTDSSTITESLTWTISQNATTNTTNYTIIGYESNTTYNNIIALDSINENRLFGIGIAGGIQLISYDITNPSNILTKNQTLPDNSGANYPTSITIYDDIIYVGTDNELYTYQNATTADATKTNFLNNYNTGLFSFDYIYDTDSITNNLTWTCRQGLTTDDARLFNQTSETFPYSISATPCKTILSTGNIIIIHKATSGIAIYNATTRNLITTITGITSQPSGATHDRLSTYGNYLFAVTGQTQITKYDITNPASPSKIADCYTNYEAQAIEAVSENEVIAGSTSGLRACDFSNTALIDPSSGKYLTTQITTYTNGEDPKEIIRLNDNGKIAIAQNKNIGIYTYTKSTIIAPTNNPPSINSITTPTNTPCANQSFEVTIQASDPENNLLTYDYDCNGVKPTMTNNYINPSFTCLYTSAGTKTIKAFAKDTSGAIVSSTKTITAQTCNTTNFLNFIVKNADNPDTNLEGVLINIVGYTSGITNTAGQASFNLDQSGTYDVTFAKTGYGTISDQATTSSDTYLVYMTPTTGKTPFNVIIQDTNNQRIPYALVSVTDPLTGIATTQSANNIGTTTFYNAPTGVELTISAGKTGYKSNFASATIIQGTSQTITITLTGTTETTNASSGRGCQDYIRGIILCSPLNTSHTGDGCTTDADCLGGECQPAWGTCSYYNYTQCDKWGMDRGAWCVVKMNALNVGKTTSETLLTYFLYFAGILIVVMIIIIIIRKK